MNEITGRLEKWVIQERGLEEFVVWGHVYDDTRERFPDGTMIHTSGIRSRPLKEGDVVTTRNSTYLLGEKNI
jgi:hypothetical protein